LAWVVAFAVSGVGDAWAASARVERLIAAMTIEEKVGQLNLETAEWSRDRNLFLTDAARARLRGGEIGGLFNMHERAFAYRVQEVAVKESRLGVPLLTGYDVVHGYRTIFPMPIGQTAAFDLDLIEASDRAGAAEALTDGVNITFAPMLDIGRDARWGRQAEGPGESAWWAARVAEARIRGFQTGGLAAPTALAACPKHLGANGATLAGLDYTSSEITERELREVHLWPFRAAARAGAGCFMAAFNTYDGVPAAANPFLLRRILRDEWRTTAMVMSDFGALSELERHGVAADDREAARLGLAGGLQMEMATRIWSRELPALARSGRVAMADLDEAVRAVLTLKERLGLFDAPFARFEATAGVLDPSPAAHRALATRFAERGFVLLKNDGDLLPLRRNVRRVTVIGPHADESVEMLGSWFARGIFSRPVSLADGLRGLLGPEVAVTVVQVADFSRITAAEIARARAAALDADAVILALGEAKAMSGEASSRTDIDLPGNQNDLAEAVLALGRPTATVVFAGRALALERLATVAPAILIAWFPGTMGGTALARVLFGEAEPGGRLPVTFPRAVGQVPLFHDRMPSGRPAIKWPDLYSSNYIDRPTTPLYPFGYGLTYTRFALGAPALDRTTMGADGQVVATVNVTNTGSRSGSTVVQLYLRNRVAPISRPVRMLRGLERLTLAPGETRAVTFAITPELFAYWRAGDRFEAAPGPIDVAIGFDAAAEPSLRFTYAP
jgi:beta-glucosidase